MLNTQQEGTKGPGTLLGSATDRPNVLKGPRSEENKGIKVRNQGIITFASQDQGKGMEPIKKNSRRRTLSLCLGAGAKVE